MIPDPITLLLMAASFLGGAAFAALLAAQRSPTTPAASRALEIAGAAVVSAGFALGQLTITDVWAKPWSEWELQPLWTGAAALIGALLRSVPFPAPGHGITAGALAVLVIRPGVQVEYTGEALQWTLLLSLTALAVATSVALTSLARRIPGPAVLGGVLLAATAAGALSLASRYATFTLLAAVLVIVLAAPVGLLLWKRTTFSGTCAPFTAHAIFLALALGGYFHTDEGARAPALSFLLVGLAPSSGWIATVVLQRSSRRAAGLLAFASTTTLLAIAVALAFV